MSVVKTPEENIFNKQLNSEQEKLKLSQFTKHCISENNELINEDFAD